MLQKFNAFKGEVLKSVKMIEVEETFDLVFSRPLGLLLAKAGAWLRLTPTQVSFLSLIVGISGGVLLYFQNQMSVIIVADLLIILAGLLDSADGQLARLTKQSTDLGRIIDGIVDNCVFFVAYHGAALFYLDVYGLWIFPFGYASGMLHSIKSAIYDFYKGEYLFYMGGHSEYEFPTMKEVEQDFPRDTFMHKIFYWLYYDYTRKQQYLSFRPLERRRRFKRWVADPDTRQEFRKLYRKHNSGILSYWALLGGTNVHRTLIMGTALFAVFDLFLFFNFVSFLFFPLLGWYQQYKDQLVEQEMKEVLSQKAVEVH